MFYSMSDIIYFYFLYISLTLAGIRHYFLALSRVISIKSSPPVPLISITRYFFKNFLSADFLICSSILITLSFPLLSLAKPKMVHIFLYIILLNFCTLICLELMGIQTPYYGRFCSDYFFLLMIPLLAFNSTGSYFNNFYFKISSF